MNTDTEGKDCFLKKKRKEKGRRAAASEEAVACASGLLAHALVLGAQTNCFEEFIFIFLFYKFLKIFLKICRSLPVLLNELAIAG